MIGALFGVLASAHAMVCALLTYVIPNATVGSEHHRNLGVVLWVFFLVVGAPLLCGWIVMAAFV
jgi:hypothetical protein